MTLAAWIVSGIWLAALVMSFLALRSDKWSGK